VHQGQSPALFTKMSISPRLSDNTLDSGLDGIVVLNIHNSIDGTVHTEPYELCIFLLNKRHQLLFGSSE
jgi:hypothetical protein